jgi:hypothetical protein
MSMRMNNNNVRGRVAVLFVAMFCLAGLVSLAQTGDGNAGINQATQLVKGYFSTGTTLLYAIGAVVGLVVPLRGLGAAFSWW